MRVAIIDYGSGNLRSATKAFERAAREAGIDAEIELTDKAERVATADRIVLPGVGAYADCRRGLDAVAGMEEALIEVVEHKARPFLGICVGMQLMSSRGLEKTMTRGIRLDQGRRRRDDARRSDAENPADRLEHAGRCKQPHPLFDGIPTGEDGLHAYFVHSYHLAAENPDDRDRHDRLWRRGDRVRRPRQHGRRAVPSGKEPDARPRPDRQFPALEALT